MKKIIVICVISVVCFGFSGITHAVQPIVMPYKKPHIVKPEEPFVNLSVKPEKVNIGIVPSRGRGGAEVELEAHIVANYPYQIKASFTPFKKLRSSTKIKPKHMSARINGSNVPIAGTAVPIIRSVEATPPGGINIPVNVNLSLENGMMYPAGMYKGDLIFTITTVSFK